MLYLNDLFSHPSFACCPTEVDHIVNAAASDNATPLLIAAQEGYSAIVAVLLHYGADANIADNNDNAKPLQYAVRNGHTK